MTVPESQFVSFAIGIVAVVCLAIWLAYWLLKRRSEKHEA